jgi:PAS domain S-box-containing protein
LSKAPSRKRTRSAKAPRRERGEGRVERLTALGRLTRLIASATDRNAAFRAIAEAATTLLDAKAAYVWVDAGGKTLREGGSFWAGPKRAGRIVRTEPVPRNASIAGAVLASRRPEFVPDVQRDPRWHHRAMAETSNLRACLALPLLHQDKAVGALIVVFGQRDALTADEQDVAALLADQAAITIENARLYEDAGRRQHEAELLAAVVRTINTSLDLTTVLPRIAERAREVCRSDAGFIALRDPGTNDVVFRHWPGARYQHYGAFRIAPGKGAAGLVLSTGRPFRTNDYLADPRIGKEFQHIATVEGMRAYMAAPITIDDRVEGFLAVANRDDRRFTDRDEQILLGLADHAAVAINNARLFSDNAARRQEAEALAELGNAIASSLELKKILSLILDRVCTLLGAQRSSVALVHPEQSGAPWIYQASRGMSPAFQHFKPQHPRDGVSPTAITERRPVWSADLLNDPAFDLAPGTRATIESEGFRAVLAVPLRVGDRVLGAVAACRDEVGPFSDRQVAFLQALADQAVLAVENSRLYEESERRRRESEVFAEVAQAITASLDLTTVLRRIADGAKDLVGSDIAAIGFREGDAPNVTVRYRVGSRFADRVLTIEPGKGLGGRALATGRPQRTDDYPNDPTFDAESTAIAVADGVVAGMVVPIKTEERVEGTLYVARRSHRSFTERDEAIIVRLAGEAAIAIRNAQLFARERASEARKGAILTAALDCIITIDHAGRIVEFNPAAERTFGYTSAQALGRELAELIVPPSLREQHRRGLAHYLATGQGSVIGRRLELTAMRADRSEFPVEIAIIAIPTDGPPMFTGFLRDISERRRAEEALHQSEAQLRQSQKMEAVGRLAGGVAHDFNNLLTVITGRTELLLLRLPPDDPRRRDIELVRKTADRAASLTHQLLAFSRKQMLQPRVLDLNGVAATMAQMLKPLIGETIELVTLLDPSLGRVKADPAQIEQILMNLAVNARDAMPQGGRLTIQTANVELDDAFVEAHPGSSIGPHAMMCVRDTGTGMSAEVQAHVFEPFFTTKGVGKGTGLGLATVYGIVKQHGGYVGIESAPGQGTAVSVYLTRVAATGEGSTEAPPDAPRATASGTVLVVEDEDELRELTAEVLGLAGYVVLSAAGPSEALEISRAYAGPIRLLLTDVVMPEMSGRDLAELLLPAHPGMRVLYMSGYTDDAIVHHGVLDPGTTLLPKPFTPDGLTRMVGDVLDR